MLEKCDRCGKEGDCYTILMVGPYQGDKPDIPLLKQHTYIGKRITEKDTETLRRGLLAGEGHVCRLLEDGGAVTLRTANQDGPFFCTSALHFLHLHSLRLCWGCQSEWKRAQEEWFKSCDSKEDGNV